MKQEWKASDPHTEAGQLTDRAVDFQALDQWEESAALIEAALLLEPSEERHYRAVVAYAHLAAFPSYLRGLEHLEEFYRTAGKVQGAYFGGPRQAAFTYAAYSLKPYLKDLSPPEVAAAAHTEREILLRILRRRMREGHRDESWIVVALYRGSASPWLLVIDPERGTVREVAADSGLPLQPEEKMPLRGQQEMLVAPFVPGHACVCGSFGRGWIALVEYDPRAAKPLRVDVFHEARRTWDVADPHFVSDAQAAFMPSCMTVLTDAVGGQRRIFIGRDDGGHTRIDSCPLLVDPTARSVSVVVQDGFCALLRHLAARSAVIWRSSGLRLLLRFYAESKAESLSHRVPRVETDPLVGGTARRVPCLLWRPFARRGPEVVEVPRRRRLGRPGDRPLGLQGEL